jgi:hypothetical protein
MESTSTQLDNPVLLRIAGVEDKVTKLGDEVLILDFVTQSESANFELAHILYKPNTRTSAEENKLRVNKLVRFCQTFGISTSTATDTLTWVGKVGRANLDYQTDLHGKPMPLVLEFVDRHADYRGKLIDENNWRGDRTRGDQV